MYLGKTVLYEGQMSYKTREPQDCSHNIKEPEPQPAVIEQLVAEYA